MTPEDRARVALRLREEREARGWGKRHTARELLKAIGAPRERRRVDSLERQMLDWESGKHFPRDWTSVYADAFGVDEADLFGDANRGSLVERPSPEGVDDDVRRRAALRLIAALGAGQAVPPGALETVLSGVEDALGNPLNLDEWERAVHEYGQLLMTRPAGALIGDLTADLVAVGELLKRQHTDRGTVGLLRVSAGLSGVLAIDLGDIGDQRAARVSWGTARRAADASGDRDLRVWVRGRAAQDAVWAGRPSQAIADLTNQAVEVAGGVPSAGLARAHAARAYIAADHGGTGQAHASLDALKRAFDQLPDHTGRQSVLAYQETQLRWAESYVHTQTGDDQAEAKVTEALALYPSDALGPVANLSLMRANLMIKDREIDAGLASAVATLHGHHVSAGMRVLGRRLLATLPERARALPAAQELRALTSG